LRLHLRAITDYLTLGVVCLIPQQALADITVNPEPVCVPTMGASVWVFSAESSS
jgi:hypothetical protein